MSFLTAVTPLTLRASCVALLLALLELTNPLNCTTPLKVSTLISADLSVGSPKMADFTLVVMAVSSTYSPVLSWVLAAPHATVKATKVATRKMGKRLKYFMVMFPKGWGKVNRFEWTALDFSKKPKNEQHCKY
jgi:hypothetical protein